MHFSVALNSKYMIDKTGLLEYTNSVLGTTVPYIMLTAVKRQFAIQISNTIANMLAVYYSKGCDSKRYTFWFEHKQ